MWKLLFSVFLIALVLFSGCTQQPSAPTKTDCPYECCKGISQYFDKACASPNVCANNRCVSQEEAEVSATIGSEEKTCNELNGDICSESEVCKGSFIDASDSDRCCSIACTPKETKLEEMNLKISDFPADFILNESLTGYETDALAYSQGDQVHADKLVSNGWEKNHSITVSKKSESEEIMGTKLTLASYYMALSKYKESDDLDNHFKNSMIDFKKTLDANGYTTMPEHFGKYSVFGKLTTTDEWTGYTFKTYILYFTKGNIFVNFIATGMSRQITDDDVAEYARLVESRIE